jgi:hypothetical protein
LAASSIVAARDQRRRNQCGAQNNTKAFPLPAAGRNVTLGNSGGDVP